jgi:hypothetical protein
MPYVLMRSSVSLVVRFLEQDNSAPKMTHSYNDVRCKQSALMPMPVSLH